MREKELKDEDLEKVTGGAEELQRRLDPERPSDPGSTSGSGSSSTGGDPGTVVFGQNQGE